MDLIITLNRWQHIRLLMALNATSDHCKAIIFDHNITILTECTNGDILISGIKEKHLAGFQKHLKRYIIAHANIIPAPFDFIL